MVFLTEPISHCQSWRLTYHSHYHNSNDININNSNNCNDNNNNNNNNDNNAENSIFFFFNFSSILFILLTFKNIACSQYKITNEKRKSCVYGLIGFAYCRKQ